MVELQKRNAETVAGTDTGYREGKAGQQLLYCPPQRHLQHLIYYANVNKWPEWPKMTVNVSNG